MKLWKASAPDVLSEEKVSADVIKRIRKLRWIGMEDEARRVQMDLRSCGISPVDMVVVEPVDTD